MSSPVVAVLVPFVGMALGLAYVLSERVRKWLGPLADLLLALRPLAIPLLVLAAAATIHLGVVVQILAAVFLVVGVAWLFVRPEWGQLTGELRDWWKAVRKGGRAVSKHLPLLAQVATLFLVAAAGALAYALRSDSPWFEGQGGRIVVVLVIGLTTWGAALVFRLVAYSRSVLRGVVAALLALAVVRSLMWAGVLPWEEHVDGKLLEPAALFAYAGVVLVVTMIGEAGREAHNPRLWKGAAAGGLGLALVAGFLVMLATAWSLWQTSLRGGDPLSRDREDRLELYTEMDSSPSHRFAPVLAFTDAQKWSPIPVRDYYAAKNFAVLRPDNSSASLADLRCPSVGPSACLHMTIDCPSASEDPDCSLAQDHPGEGPVSRGAAYVRTLRRPSRRAHGPEAIALRSIFQNVNATTRRLRKLIQYWFFYPYDEWNTSVLWGRLIQRHESDWEAVTVGLGSGDAPLFMAYSAHCGGTWRRWKDVKRAFDDHALVAVAEGSQANYAVANQRRAPDWTSCSRLPEGIGQLFSYAANVRDKTSDDWHWGARELIPATESKPPMDFPGSWGRHDTSEFVNAKPHTFQTGGGPQSPPLQVLWQRPVTTIFCGTYWHGPERCKRPKRH